MKEIKAYECGFCRKIYRSERGVTKHEVRCGKNPENDRACFGCEHLTEKKTRIFYDSPYGGGEERPVSLFFCKKHENFLYPASVEHKGNALPTDEHSNYPMPKVCAEFKEVEFNNNGF